MTRRRLIGALSSLLLGCAALGVAAAEPMRVRSDGGHFIVRVNGLGRIEPLNDLHGFDLLLTRGDGKPVSGASITLSGLRGDSNNPLPTLPEVSPGAGPGRYRAAGLRFHMPGEWRLTLVIAAGDLHDRATINVIVK